MPADIVTWSDNVIAYLIYTVNRLWIDIDWNTLEFISGGCFTSLVVHGQ